MSGRTIKTFSKSRRKTIYEKTNGICYYCGCELDLTDFHIDHLIPVANGGTNDNDNLVPSCAVCNEYKGDLSVEEFRYKIWSLTSKIPAFRLALKYYTISPLSESMKFWFERM